MSSTVQQGEISDHGEVLDALSSQHPLREAIAQYVTNAIEAMASSILICFHDERGHSCLIIKDNGYGMSRDKLDAVPKHLGTSEKRGKNMTGRRALGLITAALRLGASEVWVYSQTEQDTRTNALYIWNLLQPRFLFDLPSPPWPLRDPLKACGTVVAIPISEEMSGQIVAVLTRTKTGQSSLAHFLSEDVREELLGRGQLGKPVQIRIEITGRKKNPPAEFVTPVEYCGASVSLETVKIPGFGEIVFDLYCKTPGSVGTIRVRHHTSALANDLTRLDDFTGVPWIHFEGTVTAVFLDKAGEGIATHKKSYFLFRNALKNLEPPLTAFYQRIVEEKATSEDIGKLRQALKTILKGPLLFADKVAMPQTNIIAPDGELSPGFARADLGRTTAPVAQRGVGREPYAQPVSPSVPISKAERRDLATRTVKGLQWRFLANAKGLPYVLNCGVIEINPNHPDYIKFIDPDSHGKRGLTRMMLRLWYMAMITCWVLIDLNFPADQYDLAFRQMRFGLLFASLSAQLF